MSRKIVHIYRQSCDGGSPRCSGDYGSVEVDMGGPAEHLVGIGSRGAFEGERPAPQFGDHGFARAQHRKLPRGDGFAHR